MFAAVFVLRLGAGDSSDVIAMLYTLPIALVAVAFGLRGGLAAGATGVGLVVVWAVITGTSISPVGWAARVVPLLLLGYLLGDVTDRLRRVEAERRALARATQRHRDAVEINDSIVQGMAAAKWSLEAGDVDGGLGTLSETITLARRLVSDLLRNADMGPGAAQAASRRP